MARSVNKVILVGNIGKDPEVKFLPSGQAVANFGIATSETYKDKSGSQQERTEWHNVVAYGKVGEIVRDYVKKGAKLYVEGRLTTRSWDDKDSGKKVYRTEVVVDQLVLMSGREAGEGSGNSNYGGGNNNYSRNQTASFDQRASNQPRDDEFSHAEITDDDIPF
jgi:single-strand DNA-binding protein